MTDDEIKKEHRIGVALVTVLVLFLSALFLAYFNTTKNLLECIGKDKATCTSYEENTVDDQITTEQFKFLGACKINIDTEHSTNSTEESIQSDPFRITDMSFICQLNTTVPNTATTQAANTTTQTVTTTVPTGTTTTG